MHPNVYARIHLPHIKRNIDTIKKHTGRPVIAVVKADAYGHGLERVVDYVEDDVLMFAVANINEALRISHGRVLIFQPLSDMEEVEIAVERGFVFNLSFMEQLDVISSINSKNPARVHIEVDTGMNRTGIWYEEFPQLYDRVLRMEKSGKLRLEGIFTHFASADLMEDDFTYIQLERFRNVLKNVKRDGLLIHAANTSASLRYPEAYFDAVRVGIGIYGVVPSGFLRNRISLEPAMGFMGKVIQKKVLRKGESIGYGRTFFAEEDMDVAIVACGYADGYPWEGSGRLSVYGGGMRRRVLGRVSMDLIAVEGEGLNVGDEVELWGRHIRVEDVAEALGKIPYDLMVGIGRRVVRIY